jgi:3-oxoadipate enol-lactonase
MSSRPKLYSEGRGSGEPLLLIMGMAGNHRLWGEPFLAALSQHFEVLIFDQRGIGTSDRADGQFSTADLADDAASLLDEVGWSDANVFGISLGGMVAQELALNHRDRIRRLTLGCTYPGGELDTPAQARFIEAVQTRDPEISLPVGFETNLSAEHGEDPANYAQYRLDVMAVKAPVPVILMQYQAALNHNAISRLPQLDVPTLVVHGSADEMILPENGKRLAGLVPNARWELLEGAAHLFWREQPERVIQLLQD